MGFFDFLGSLLEVFIAAVFCVVDIVFDVVNALCDFVIDTIKLIGKAVDSFSDGGGAILLNPNDPDVQEVIKKGMEDAKIGSKTIKLNPEKVTIGGVIDGNGKPIAIRPIDAKEGFDKEITEAWKQGKSYLSRIEA